MRLCALLLLLDFDPEYERLYPLEVIKYFCPAFSWYFYGFISHSWIFHPCGICPYVYNWECTQIYFFYLTNTIYWLVPLFPIAWDAILFIYSSPIDMSISGFSILYLYLYKYHSFNYWYFIIQWNVIRQLVGPASPYLSFCPWSFLAILICFTYGHKNSDLVT